MIPCETLKFRGSRRVVAIAKRMLKEVGLKMPVHTDTRVAIRATGDPITGFPVRKVVLQIVLEDTSVDELQQQIYPIAKYI